MLLAALTLAACETPAPAPQPAPAPVPTVRPEDAPPLTIATAPSATAEPAPTPPPTAEGSTAEAPPPAPLPATLTPAQIEKTFKLHQRYFGKLYKQRLPAHAGLAGTVYVNFQVRPDGSVEGARLADATVRDTPFEASIVKQVSEMTFPPAQQATPVSRYPLTFTAGKARK